MQPTTRLRGAVVLVALVLACGDGNGPNSRVIAIVSGNNQTGTVGQALPQPLVVSVVDGDGLAVAGLTIQWTVASGGGSIPASSVTGADGTASASLMLGTGSGQQTAGASVQGGGSVTFTATGTPAAANAIAIQSGDGQIGDAGQALTSPYQARVTDQYGNGVPGVAVTWAVTAGGGTLSATSTTTDAQGVARVTLTLGPGGANRVSATAAGLAGSPLTFNAFASIPPTLVVTLPVPANYGIHDTFVRDGLVFVCVWNSGLLIYDVGNGMKGGTPGSPQLVSSIVTSDASARGVSGGPQVHNAWWFWNQVTSEKKYVFIGQEGPATLPSSSSGDIHVVDVSNLNAPVEVAFYHMAVTPPAGTHNFWVDEQAQLLYAAYYNGGVVALDVSGTLSGDLASREITRYKPSSNSFVWGVQLVNGSLYTSDFYNGLFQLKLTGNTFSVAGGGVNVPERWTSDLWVTANYAYTGTWGGSARAGIFGNALKIWQLDVAGAPSIKDSIIVPDVQTLSDVQVSADGKQLVFSTERGVGSGVYVYGLTDPAKPAFIGRALDARGIHTATVADIAGKRYVFAARNPGSPAQPAMLIYEITALIP